MSLIATTPKSAKAILRTYQVFVSHATADKWLAKAICEKLESKGVTTFRDDRDIAGGDDIPEELVKKIIKSNELLVVLTPESASRPWVMLEVGAAWGRRKRIVAVLCHVTVDPIPSIIKSKRAYHLNEFDAYLTDVSARARRGNP